MKNVVRFRLSGSYREDVQFFLLTLIFVLVTAVSGSLLFNLDIAESLSISIVAFLAFYTLGSIITTISFGSRQSSLPGIIFSLAVGVVVFPVAYRLYRQVGLGEELLTGWIIIQSLIWLYLFTRNEPVKTDGFNAKPQDLLGLIALIAFISLLLYFSHFRDVILIPDGFLYGTGYMTESVFHLGLINALESSYPPPSLYASGPGDFGSYHLNMHLQIEFLNRLTGVSSLTLTSFYAPFVYFFLLVSTPFAFVKMLGGGVRLATLCGLLVFSADFSFILGLLIQAPDYPWTLYLTSTIWSLFTLNGYLPSVIALSCCIVFLYDYLNNKRQLTLLAFFLCAAGAFGFKSSMGLQIAASAMGLSAIMIYQDHRSRTGWGILISSGAALIAMVAFSFAIEAISNTEIIFKPFSVITAWLSTIGLQDADVSWYPLFVPILILGSLGIKSFGLCNLSRPVMLKSAREWLLLYVLLFFVGGFILSDTIFIGNPETHINDGIWFYVQALMAALFALYISLEKTWSNHGKRWMIATLLIVFSFPTTIQFLYLRVDQQYERFGPDEIAVIKFLKTLPSDAVVLHPLNKSGPSLSSNFAGRVSVLNVFRSFVEPDDGLSGRVSAVNDFFNPESSPTMRLEVLKNYEVTFIYAPRTYEGVLTDTPGLREVFATKTISVLEVISSSGELVSDPSLNNRASDKQP